MSLPANKLLAVAETMETLEAALRFIPENKLTLEVRAQMEVRLEQLKNAILATNE